MRLSSATVVAAACIALLAGCSNSSQSPLSSAPGIAPNAVGGPVAKVLTRAQVQQLHPNVLSPSMQKVIASRHFVRPSHLKRTGIPKMWLTDDAGYIWGILGKNVVTYLTDCSGAEGARVDHNGRLIVACTNSATVNIYNAGNVTGPADVVLYDTSGFYPADAFIDTAGNIYATNLYGFSCTTYNCYFNYGDIVWWSTGNQNNGSSPSGSYTDPNMYENFFADVDASGNVYLDGLNLNSIVPEVDEITGITGTAPSSTNLGISLNFPGGVYVNSPTKPTAFLSINDQGCYGCGNNSMSTYALPYTGAAGPWGPIVSPQNLNHTCDPVGGGFNKADSKVLLGDAGCRAGMLGATTANTWKQLLNINFSDPIDGAFLKSDK